MPNDKRTYFKFERLEVWQHARRFADSIYCLTGKFPKNELLGITNQLRRAATSITLNIAEGSERQSDQDFKRFLKIALASVNEVVAALFISYDQKFINGEGFEEVRRDAGHLAAQIKSFIKALNKS